MLEVHKPVLCKEIAEVFSKLQIKAFLDCTVGAGGHAKYLLENCIKENGIYIGFDQDENIIEIARKNLEKYSDRVILVNRNYTDLKRELEKLKIESIDAVLFDLGVSSLQFDTPERGFSYRFEAPLDMRMDVRNNLTAYDVVNGYEKEDLVRIFRQYSDLRNVNFIVGKIIKMRSLKVIKTTKDLTEIFAPNVLSLKQRKILDTVIAVFQTLRIEVNDEMNKLKEGLNLAFDCLKSGGYIGVISFHSIEDRIVKTFFREKIEACKCSKALPYCICKNESKASEVTKKPIMPSIEEINENPRSRSSKLRVVCKL